MNIFLNVSHKQIYSMEDVAKYLFEEGGVAQNIVPLIGGGREKIGLPIGGS